MPRTNGTRPTNLITDECSGHTLKAFEAAKPNLQIFPIKEIKEQLEKMKKEGLRHNEGKLRYDLIPASADKGIAEVLTFGANKYAERNWELGMKWSKVIASLKRHLAAFEEGEDFDKESSLMHIDHILTNASFIKEYYKTCPELDDRPHKYLRNKKIGLDIDGVLANLHKTLCDWCGEEYYEPNSWDCPKFLEMFNMVKNNEEFFLDIEPLLKPEEIGFEPAVYITSRSIPVEITQEWLRKNGFPDVPVYSIGFGESKVDAAKKAGIDYFIDDHYKNFVELNSAGICTFLMTTKYNEKYNVGYKRIKDFVDFKERFL